MVNAVVQRFDSYAVTNQPELTLFGVPQSNGKHAAKLVNTVDTPFLKRMKDHFGIRMICLPAVSTPTFQLRTNFAVLVNLTVENHPYRAVLVAHWLHGSFRQVNDR